MGKRTRAQQDRWNEQRRVNKSKARQALFIAEYFQTKYFELYSEAASFFNVVNKLYPMKYDARKTPEFRQWKSRIMGEALKSKKRTIYLSIEADEIIPQHLTNRKVRRHKRHNHLTNRKVRHHKRHNHLTNRKVRRHKRHNHLPKVCKHIANSTIHLS